MRDLAGRRTAAPITPAPALAAPAPVTGNPDAERGKVGAGWAARVEAMTPPGRDRGVDALRALAIAGVVLGHWLVTAWVPGPRGTVSVSSPLASMPELAPLSWVLQTLAVFFFVGGYAAARSLRTVGDPARAAGPAWVRARMGRLLRPVVPLVLVWAGIAAGLALHGAPYATVRALALPALGPIWFLAVFAALTAATPLLLKLRPGVTAASAAAVVLAVDAVRFGLDGPGWLGWVNLAAGWLVPYMLGVGWAGGGLASRRTAVALLAGGAAGTAALVAGFGYPASMVGVPGAGVSNLSPPTLAAVAFGLAQVGLALLAHGPLGRLMRRPRLWAAVALLNLSAMTIFLWHLTAAAVTTLAALRFGAVPGLLTPPARLSWLPERLVWLPVFGGLLVLAGAAAKRLNDRVSRSA
ncbi:acyltransferase [Planobispora longispora]|uniref:Acyltransferase n=1 Tax=Planobispora longispora TaxID=28887 RepID=A0A8J3RH77_9ACTN|nr:acyltransferase [Planobispora longispora]GIH73797.1 acyltransferase [Planobispora longispora]